MTGLMLAASPWTAIEFRAMGSRCRVVAPDPQHAQEARRLVDELERCWTRFAPDSELSRVNAAAGDLCLISRELHLALSIAARAHELSRGLFDIRCLDAVERVGYDRSWEDQQGRHLPRPARSAGCTASAAPPSAVELFDDPPAVLVTTGQRLDLGGIGKGLAADLVVERLLAAGADRVQVELGGDLRVAGDPWVGDRWTVEVDDALVPGRTALELDLDGGAAVATSSVLRRRWRRDGLTTHHIIDPRTMASAPSDLVTVTAIAHEAWRADVAAKCALIAGRARAAETAERLGARVLLFDARGYIDEAVP